jgi:hypothetical protein
MADILLVRPLRRPAAPRIPAATGSFAVFAVIALVTFTATAESRRRGRS